MPRVSTKKQTAKKKTKSLVPEKVKKATAKKKTPKPKNTTKTAPKNKPVKTKNTPKKTPKKSLFKKGNTIGMETRFKEGREKTGGRVKKSPEELEGLWNRYLEVCVSKNLPITVQGVCKALGLSKSTFYAFYKKDPLYREIIERIYINIEEYWTRFGMTGKATAFTIFYLKNFFGWKDDRSLRLGGVTGEDGNPEPVKIIVQNNIALMNAVRGRIDQSDEGHKT